jgi:hypothetical protein
MWSCSELVPSPMLHPMDLAEEKLAIQRGPRGRKILPLIAEESTILRLATFMRQSVGYMGSSSCSSQQVMIIQAATDGGATAHHPVKVFNRYAGWGAAVFANGSDKSQFDDYDGTQDLSSQQLLSFKVVGGIVPGLDSSAYAAELWAAIIAVSAASRLQEQGATVQLHLFIDNAAVCKLVRDAGRGLTKLPGQYCFQTAWLAEAARNIQLQSHWVPSHGKSTDWTAPISAQASTGQIRALNAAADIPASKNAAQQLRSSQACDGANLRQQKALERMLKGSSGYRDKVFA